MRVLITKETKNGPLPLEVSVARITNPEDYVELTHRYERCSGCQNRDVKFGCPPKSPEFTKLKKRRYLYVICVRVWGKDVDVVNSKAPVFGKMSFMHVITKGLSEKIARKLSGQFDVALIAGSCRQCAPCAAKLGETKCKKRVLYSLESVGFLVNKLVKDLFDISLVWYKKGEGKTPRYFVGVTGIYTDTEITKGAFNVFIKQEVNK